MVYYIFAVPALMLALALPEIAYAVRDMIHDNKKYFKNQKSLLTNSIL